LLPGRAEPLLVTEPGWATGYPAPASRLVLLSFMQNHASGQGAWD